MTGLPTLIVELEDGSGNFTNDITAYVRQRTWSLSRGWSDENDEDNIQPAQLQMQLDNLDGRFTLGASNYNGITKDKRIRLSETVGANTYRRVVGYVIDWPTKWESAVANVAIAGITAMDRFSRLNRRKLRATTEHEILSDGPYSYFTLGEEAGATSVGDTSGNGRGSLVVVQTGTSPGTVPEFGATGFNEWDGVTSGQFADNFCVLQGSKPVLVTTSTSLTYEIAAVIDPLTSAGAFLAMQKQDPLSQGTVFITNTGIVLEAGGQVHVVDLDANTVCTSPGTYKDGLPHVFAVTVSGTTWTLFVDGVSVASGAGNSIPSSTSLYVSRIGSVLGRLGHFSTYTSALSSGRLLSHANSILNGFGTERADQRIARLAGYANVATGDQNLETGQQPSIAAQAIRGVTALEAMRDVAQAEGGGLFIAPDGKLTLHNKGHRVIKATGSPAATFTADQIDPDDAEFEALNYLFNTATGTRAGGAEQRSVNAASVAKYEEWATDRSNALLPTDELLLNELTWITTMYAEPLPRLSTFTLDLLTLPQATVQAALALELGDHVRISSWPTQAPASALDLIVEGFKESQSEKTWKLTFNTAPAQLFYAWILGDATYSVLGSTTRLYF